MGQPNVAVANATVNDTVSDVKETASKNKFGILGGILGLVGSLLLGINPILALIGGALFGGLGSFFGDKESGVLGQVTPDLFLQKKITKEEILKMAQDGKIEGKEFSSVLPFVMKGFQDAKSLSGEDKDFLAKASKIAQEQVNNGKMVMLTPESDDHQLKAIVLGIKDEATDTKFSRLSVMFSDGHKRHVIDLKKKDFTEHDGDKILTEARNQLFAELVQATENETDPSKLLEAKSRVVGIFKGSDRVFDEKEKQQLQDAYIQYTNSTAQTEPALETILGSDFKPQPHLPQTNIASENTQGRRK